MPSGRPLLQQDDALRLGWLAVLRAVDVSRRAPLSARQALNAAVQIDQLSDRVFATRAALSVPPLARAADILTFRAALRACDPAFGPIMDLTACCPYGPSLQVTATEVAPEGFDRLGVADLMVSLYNAGTVPRLMMLQPGGTMLPMQNLLQHATARWGAILDHDAVADHGQTARQDR